ncbi:MAG: excinuclease ABC subunit UvrA [Chitinophagales bacterium]|nr:excinuclease ABC subunit UvrA [Chitinophagales bacterium]
MVKSGLNNVNNQIIIKGARVHNLKNVDVSIPHNKLIVITGVSGSGKSSLTMDTLYAEGQRRYVESLNSYARQFLSRMNKPDVEYIKGIAPAIALEQRVSTATTRSTVGTMTEIYEYLRLLYAKIGKTYSPVSGQLVVRDTVSSVIDFINLQPLKTKGQVLVPLHLKKNENWKDVLTELLQKGFVRVLLNEEVVRIEEILDENTPINSDAQMFILIDRFVVDDTEEEQNRIADSINIGFEEGQGVCVIDFPHQERKSFSTRFELDGISFEEPSSQFFNFNSPYGACKTCEGFGTIIGIDENLVIPDRNLSVYDYGVAAWKGETMGWWRDQFIKKASTLGFPIHKPIRELTKEQYQLLWNGDKSFYGIHAFFKDVESQLYKVQYRVMLSRYRGRTACPECQGSRLRGDTAYVKINGKHIGELLLMPIKNLISFFKTLDITDYEKSIAQRILVEINNRLRFMQDVGLDYLTLNRFANTLSGGETQRIHLTRSLGSNLTSSLYILDEPSIGLHPHDTGKLVKILKHLRNLGNTVIVVEHEEDAIRAADFLVDVGPYAGNLGGEIVFAGDFKTALTENKTLTAKYLNGELSVSIPEQYRTPINFIEFEGCYEHNLKHIDVKIPLQALTVITGVSGSGKTTLVKKIIYPVLKATLDRVNTQLPKFKNMGGNWKKLTGVEFVDQNPIGRSSRSNPVTYTKAYDLIRDLMASQPLSKIRGYEAKHFSFNVDGGRCDECKGEGEQIVEMQFLADVHLMCDSCKGMRFKKEILEVKYKEKNIDDILHLTVDEAIAFFEGNKKLIELVMPLQQVGLGYIQLGQSSSTLSGGEAQRVKLATFLKKGIVEKPVLFIFDEPTTGLHFHDISKLMQTLQQLVESGHSVMIIEHNLEVIKCADWIVDLGPVGGDEGGYLVEQGNPYKIAENQASLTGRYLKEKLRYETSI